MSIGRTRGAGTSTVYKNAMAAEKRTDKGTLEGKYKGSIAEGLAAARSTPAILKAKKGQVPSSTISPSFFSPTPIVRASNFPSTLFSTSVGAATVDKVNAKAAAKKTPLGSRANIPEARLKSTRSQPDIGARDGSPSVMVSSLGSVLNRVSSLSYNALNPRSSSPSQGTATGPTRPASNPGKKRAVAQENRRPQTHIDSLTDSDDSEDTPADRLPVHSGKRVVALRKAASEARLLAAEAEAEAEEAAAQSDGLDTGFTSEGDHAGSSLSGEDPVDSDDNHDDEEDDEALLNPHQGRTQVLRRSSQSVDGDDEDYRREAVSSVGYIRLGFKQPFIDSLGQPVQDAPARRTGKGLKRQREEARYECTDFEDAVIGDLPSQSKVGKVAIQPFIKPNGGLGSGKHGQFTVSDMSTVEKEMYTMMCRKVRLRIISSGKPWASAGALVTVVTEIIGEEKRKGVEIDWHSGFQAQLYQYMKSAVSKYGAQIKPRVIARYDLAYEVTNRKKGEVHFAPRAIKKAAEVLDSGEVLRADGQAGVDEDSNLFLGTLLHECAVCLLGPGLTLPRLSLDGPERELCVNVGFGLLALSYCGILRTLEHAKAGRGAWEFSEKYEVDALSLLTTGRKLSMDYQDPILLKLWAAAGAHSLGLGALAAIESDAGAARLTLFRKR
ncbi:hypothetical protein P7C70_g3876, partial [Phenoliferia sp. Uapishka_3]